MKTLLRRFGRINSMGLLLGLALVAGAVFLGAGFHPAAQPAAREVPSHLNQRIQIENKTQSIEVVRAETNETSVHISLRNNSNKSVDGLQTRIGNVAIQTEFLGAGVTFPAGSVHEATFPIQADMDKRPVTLLCVTFEDGSSEGDPKYIRQIENKRLGERIQTKRALLLIDQALSRSEVNAETLESLKRDISVLPVRLSGNANNDIALGLQDRKSFLISQIEGLSRKQGLAIGVAQELITLKQHLNRSIKQ